MRQRATKQQIAITIGLLIAVAAAGFWWAPHIHWSYLVSRNKFKLNPVKVIEMPPASPPKSDWYTCRAGAVSLQLPPGMAEEAERTVSKTPQALSLTTPNYELILLIPSQIPVSPRPAIEQLAAEMQLSPMQFIVQSYRAGTDDFRWTMSRTELRRHKLLLDLSALFYPHTHVMVVETYSDAALEGMLVMHNDKTQAMHEWRLKSGQAAGFLRFGATKGQLDFDDLRTVCRSVKCDESRLGPELTPDQLAVLADTMTIELDALTPQKGVGDIEK